MRCSNCGIDNAAGSQFWGTPLSKTWPKCTVENAHDAKFCSQCGAPLNQIRRAETESREQALVGERRHLTILFCDLIGSTVIAAQSDPEEWRDVVDGYHRAAAEAITRSGGYVAQYLGDGVIAYFGWPEAHDNNGERAAREFGQPLVTIAHFIFVFFRSGTFIYLFGRDHNACFISRYRPVPPSRYRPRAHPSGLRE